jgi:hypothetical protein
MVLDINFLMEETMKRYFLFTLVLICFALVFVVCGGKEETGEAAETQTEEKADTSEAASEKKGEEIAKEILSTFDQAIAEVLEVVKDKPEPADVKAQIDEIYSKYEEKMKEINTRYLALRDEDIELFGQANGYIGENRGRHVMEMNTTLDQYIYYYGQEKGDTEFADAISKGFIKLLDIAAQH